MIPLRSPSDSLTFTRSLSAIRTESNFSRCPYGAAASLVVILIWVYYSAQIFLLGAEFTWIYARTFGSMRSGVHGLR